MNHAHASRESNEARATAAAFAMIGAAMRGAGVTDASSQMEILAILEGTAARSDDPKVVRELTIVSLVHILAGVLTEMRVAGGLTREEALVDLHEMGRMIGGAL
jgi:hypothetical protein